MNDVNDTENTGLMGQPDTGTSDGDRPFVDWGTGNDNAGSTQPNTGAGDTDLEEGDIDDSAGGLSG